MFWRCVFLILKQTTRRSPCETNLLIVLHMSWVCSSYVKAFELLVVNISVSIAITLSAYWNFNPFQTSFDPCRNTLVKNVFRFFAAPLPQNIFFSFLNINLSAEWVKKKLKINCSFFQNSSTILEIYCVLVYPQNVRCFLKVL